MKFPAVHWHEGLFLQPHHFQAWDRHWNERVGTAETWQNPHAYGLHEIEINRSALAAGFLQIDSLSCKTPGSSLVHLGLAQQLERRDLRPALAIASKANQAIDVYVGVARLQLGHKNVDGSEHLNGTRFHSHWFDYPDESDAASVQPVELKRLNARLLLSTDDLAGFDLLKIAMVRQSDRNNTIAQLDAEYIPPLLDVGAWPELRNQVLIPIYDSIQQHAERLAARIRDVSDTLSGSTPHELQNLMVLQAINPAASVLRVIIESHGIHPLTAYIELARLAGSIELFQPARFTLETKGYDHENIGKLFIELRHRIFTSLAGLSQAAYRQMTFIGNDLGMHVSIEPEAIASSQRWILGVKKGELSRDRLQRLLSPSNLDWKLGSQRQVESLFVKRSPGVELKLATSLPASLPKGDAWIYYDVAGQDQAAWKDVLASGSLAMRLRDSSIVDPISLKGSRTLNVRFDDETVSLQFSLFGVR
jgi:type VI secretion system protein ImpJ